MSESVSQQAKDALSAKLGLSSPDELFDTVFDAANEDSSGEISQSIQSAIDQIPADLQDEARAMVNVMMSLADDS
ncbi:hypothetical protein H6770_00720 [Candidatus Peribacteria bacterium]|nr:hypothetical protein [Candidatus Peribacteria bacterium]